MKQAVFHWRFFFNFQWKYAVTLKLVFDSDGGAIPARACVDAALDRAVATGRGLSSLASPSLRSVRGVADAQRPLAVHVRDHAAAAGGFAGTQQHHAAAGGLRRDVVRVAVAATGAAGSPSSATVRGSRNPRPSTMARRRGPVHLSGAAAKSY